MKTNLFKRIITIAAAVAVTLAIVAGGAFAQGSVPNGTVRDGNLVWLKIANCFCQTWDQAMSSAASLKSGMCGLTDGSTAGQWRLPTKDELARRARNTQGFDNVRTYIYWSSNSTEYNTSLAYGVEMITGSSYSDVKTNRFYVWPVRSVK